MQYKRSWVEIDLKQLKQNYQTYVSICSNQTRIMAVTKANAYGHGDVAVARCLQDVGVSLFAVSNIKEAISLRDAGIQGDILILGYTPVEAVDLLRKYDLTQTLLSKDYAERFSLKAGKSVKCQFAINTGMNRIGLNSKNLDDCEHTIRQYAEKLDVTGIFTHLCVADSIEESDVCFTREQIQTFEALAEKMQDLNFEFIHCMNSAGGLNAASRYHDIVRLGIVLYGLYPSKDIVLPDKILPILKWKSTVSMIETVEQGETIGYGRAYLAPKKMRIATIPTGYADGYPRALSGKGYVLIRGKKAPIVGKICMDQMMVDVTNIPNVQFEDEVVLIGQSSTEVITADMIASMIGTIGYEIVCDISPRVDRVYIEQ